MLFAEAEYRFFRQLKEQGYVPGTVYDIGASNGYWSVRIHEALGGGKFHLFEPLAEVNEDYKRLLGTALAANPDLALHQVALGKRNRHQPMTVYSDGFGSSLVNTVPLSLLQRLRRLRRPSIIVPEVKSVPVRRLDDYVAEQGLPPPDVLKLDVQGYELQILAGAGKALETAKIVLLECWLTRGYGRGTPLLHEVLGWMRKRDFAPVDFGETFVDERHELSALDVYFMHKSLIDEKRYRWTIWQ